MTAESPTITVSRFSQNWGTKDPNSLFSEFLSISKETNREPDTYHFIATDGLLLDPNTSKPILDFIAEGVEKDVARKLQSWADRNDEGMALWISPLKEGFYPCPKIIFHQISNTGAGQKVILNTVILFDTENEIINSEHKRGTLYTFPDSKDNLEKILSFIKRKSGKEQNLKSSNRTSAQKAEYFVNQIQKGISYQAIIQEMAQSGFLGNKPISCPRGLLQSFSKFTLENSSVINLLEKHGSSDKLCCTCPVCDKQVEAEIYDGKIHCPNCGASAAWRN